MGLLLLQNFRAIRFRSPNFEFVDFMSARPPSPNLSHLHFRLSECQPVSSISREESVWNNA